MLLVPAGAYCLLRAAKARRELLALAATPLCFAVQQACEGMVWLGLSRGDGGLARTAALAFLFFAIIFWPAFVPWAARALVARPRASRALALAAVVALGISSFAYASLVATESALGVSIAGHAIRYDFESALAFRWVPRAFWQVAYVSVVSIPLMIARDRAVRIFGSLVLASSILAQIAFARAFISVWCLFAALLSSWLCLWFRSLAPLRTLDASARRARVA